MSSKASIITVKLLDDKYFQPPMADKLEGMRNAARQSKVVITYDCYNAIVRGDRVVCKLGRRFLGSKNGSIYLLSVLRGICSSVCAKCQYYDDGNG